MHKKLPLNMNIEGERLFSLVLFYSFNFEKSDTGALQAPSSQR